MQITIPQPLLVTLDDAGWWLGRDGSADNQPFRTGMPRQHVPEDYEALIALGKGLNMRIPAGFILGEWDETGLLQDVPSATWMGKNWASPFLDKALKEKTAEIIRQGNAYLELAVHGLCHEFWDQGKMQRTEFHDNQGNMRRKSVVRQHLEYFFRLMETFNLAGSPRLFIPPALNHCFGEGKNGFQAIANEFGLQYIALVFSRARCVTQPQFEGFGWEENILLLDRGITGILWNQVAQTPQFLFDYPILPLHWANILHADPARNMEVINSWLTFLQQEGGTRDIVFAKDIAGCITQYLHATQSRIHIERNKCIVHLDWLKNVPRQNLADELFFTINLPEKNNITIHGARQKKPLTPHEAQFITLDLPNEDSIIFEFREST